jgi:hypothetical protein
MRNFNGIMEIVGALTNSQVSKLIEQQKGELDSTHSSIYCILEELCDQQHNGENLKKMVKEMKGKPYVPVLSFFLAFMEIKNERKPTYIKKGSAFGKLSKFNIPRGSFNRL